MASVSTPSFENFGFFVHFDLVVGFARIHYLPFLFFVNYVF